MSLSLLSSPRASGGLVHGAVPHGELVDPSFCCLDEGIPSMGVGRLLAFCRYLSRSSEGFVIAE